MLPVLPFQLCMAVGTGGNINGSRDGPSGSHDSNRLSQKRSRGPKSRRHRHSPTSASTRSIGMPNEIVSRRTDLWSAEPECMLHISPLATQTEALGSAPPTKVAWVGLGSDSLGVRRQRCLAASSGVRFTMAESWLRNFPRQLWLESMSTTGARSDSRDLSRLSTSRHRSRCPTPSPLLYQAAVAPLAGRPSAA